MRSARRRLDHDAASLNGVIAWRIDAANLLDGETMLFDGFRLGRILGLTDRNEAGLLPAATASQNIAVVPLSSGPAELLAPSLSSEVGPDLAVPAFSAPDLLDTLGAASPPAAEDQTVTASSAPARQDTPSAALAPASDDDPAKPHPTGGVLQAPAPAPDRPLNAAANGGTVILRDDGVGWFVDAGLGADVTLSLAVAGSSTISVDLAGAPAVGDGQADTLNLSGTNAVNTLTVTGAGTSYSITGLSATVNVVGSEGALDTLVLNGLGANDAITATTLPAGVTRLTLDGGAGDDSLLGSQGADILLGGDNNDFVFGDNGNDTAFLGAGNDIFQWDPGDGNDTIEGQGDTDRLNFFGSNATENINILANGGRALFTRDVANITMDMNDVEQIRYNALGGADNIVVGDMTGTDVTLVELNLAAAAGGGDAQLDSVTVNGTNGDDNFGVAPGGGGLSVFGLTANTVLLGAEATDRLTLNALGGADVIDATGLAAGNILLTINAGLGADIVLGSAGDDTVNGGDGDDTALMGAGNDTFVWNPGDDNDTLEGQAGTSDRLLFNGANVAENISITANGGRIIFFRDVANVNMDLNDIEIIEYNALGGADAITVNNLAGTDVTTVQINLAGSNGLGDGAVDTVTINGTAGADTITLTNSGTTVTVSGLAYQIVITGFESTDQLIINTLGGNDTVDGDALDVNVAFTANGGENDDILLGGAAADTLNGENGNDFLRGNGGVDSLNGGAGTNTIVAD